MCLVISPIIAICDQKEKTGVRCVDLGFGFHGSLPPLGLDLLRQDVFHFTISLYRPSKSLSFCLFRLSITALIIAYVVVELVDFLVIAKRDAKSVTIRGQEWKALPRASQFLPERGALQ